jgi:hypothetical protein
MVSESQLLQNGERVVRVLQRVSIISGAVEARNVPKNLPGLLVNGVFLLEGFEIQQRPRWQGRQRM